jgi:ElaB/YqjD/DUF883 family membrane-anchored ribosome-binding protein
MQLASKEKDLMGSTDRSLRETRRDFDKRIDAIRAELKQNGPGAVEEAERSLSDLKEDIQRSFEDKYGELHERFENKLEGGRREVRKQPLLAVGVAVMAGLIVGMLLEKSKN